MPYNQKKEYDKLLRRTNKYATDVSVLFSQAVNALLGLQKEYSLGPDEVFSFEDNPHIAKQASDILRRLHSATYAAISKGIRLEWAAGNDAADQLLSSMFGRKVLNDPRFAGWRKRNKDAMDAFFSRTRDDGMTLSNRVWSTTKQLRREMELAMTVSIGEGESASHISRQVRKYLREPDRLFRRVKDKATGNLGLSKAAAAYHPGQGVYRSSYKNAMRLARTETNMAYRTADNLRWEQMEFVTGIRINLSHNHPVTDICDTLAGDYPKDFRFTGWHPQCFCYATPITCDEDDFVRMQQAVLAGEEPVTPSGIITEMPESFNAWMLDNKERIMAARREDRLPYFLRDNWDRVKDVYLPPVTDTPQWKAGNALFTKMQAIKDIDLSALKTALSGKDIKAIEAATKEIRKIEAELAGTTYVDDAFEVAKTWGYNTTMGIEKSVAAKMQAWSGLSLEEQAKKLHFEANDYLGGNMMHKVQQVPVQTLYPSWEVSQKAYLKQLGIVQEKIEWQGIEMELNAAKGNAGGITMAPWKNAVAKLDDAVAAKDMTAAKKAITEIQEWDAINIQYKEQMQWYYKHPKSTTPAYLDLLDKLDDTAILKGDAALAKKLLAEMDEWKVVLEELAQQEQFVTKSGPYIELLDKFQQAVADKDIATAKARMADVLAKREELAKKAAQRKGGKGAFDSTYSQARKDAALWDTGDGTKADDALFDSASRSWRNAIDKENRTKQLIDDLKNGRITQAQFDETLKREGLAVYSCDSPFGTFYMTQREAMYEYTHHYSDVNEPLELRKYYCGQKPDRFYMKVNAMTDYLDTCATPVDMWFQRGDSDLSAVFGRLRFAGVDVPSEVEAISSIYGDSISDKLIEKLQQFVGKTMQEGGFMSMGTAKRKGFNETNKRVIVNIFAPKGTKAMYAENFSDFGYGAKSAKWDGVSRTRSFSQEFETIAQRGTRMRITKIEKGVFQGEDIIYIDVEIVGQETKDLSYVPKELIGIGN